jgi:predicted SAM-dependent methyltransferase
MRLPVKLELGAGHRPSRGYEHNDRCPFDHIEHVGDPWMLDLPDGSIDEILALAFVEHLTFGQALDTFRAAHRMLRRGGWFLFDVPDYPVWAGMYLAHLAGEDWPPVTLEHCRLTLFGWGRWPGDEHKYGWDSDLLGSTLERCGFSDYRISKLCPDEFPARAHRDRFTNPADAHLYVAALR